MGTLPPGAIAVIFVSRRTANDDAGYAAAAAAMMDEAARQPGYLGVRTVHDEAGHGITISYWADDAAAIAWRDHAEHAAIREQGRATWYDSYELIVASITRGYDWQRKNAAPNSNVIPDSTRDPG